MTDSPRVSVVVPVFNAEAHVEKAIDSILAQTFTDFELRIADDGSTDDSGSIIKRRAELDERIVFTSHTNIGMAKTLNRLIQDSHGEYVARLDADDMMQPMRLEKQVAFLDSHPQCHVLGSAVVNIDDDDDPLSIELYPAAHSQIEQQMLAGQGGIIHPSVMLRRDAVLAVNGFAEDCPVVEDQELWLRMALGGELNNLQEPLTEYRVHACNMTFTKQATARTQLLRVIDEARHARGLPLGVELQLAEPIASDWDRRRIWAWSAIEAGYLRTARKHAWRLWKESKTSRSSLVLVAHAYFPKISQWIRTTLGLDVAK